MPGYDLAKSPDFLTARVIGAAVEVHRHLGPGLLEAAYANALEHELLARGISFVSEVLLPIYYKGSALDVRLRIDFESPRLFRRLLQLRTPAGSTA